MKEQYDALGRHIIAVDALRSSLNDMQDAMEGHEYDNAFADIEESLGYLAKAREALSNAQSSLFAWMTQ